MKKNIYIYSINSKCRCFFSACAQCAPTVFSPFLGKLAILSVSVRSVSHSLRIINPSAVFSVSLFFFPRVIEWLGEASVTLVLVQLCDCCLKTSFIQ